MNHIEPQPIARNCTAMLAKNYTGIRPLNPSWGKPIKIQGQVYGEIACDSASTLREFKACLLYTSDAADE